MRVKLRHIPPNVATAMSLCLALVSVMMAGQGNFELAAWMILWSVVLDKLDGTLARVLKAGTEFGVQFDSIADFCAFGIAPGFVTYELLRNHKLLEGLFSSGTNLWLLGAAVCLYVLAVGARLARFNVDNPVLGDKFFMGIPTTMCGAILASFMLTCLKYDLGGVLRWFPIYLLVAGFAMVSSIRIPKLLRRKSNFVNALQVLAVTSILVFGALRILPEVLFGMAMTYLVVGVVHTRITGVVRRARSAQ